MWIYRTWFNSTTWTEYVKGGASELALLYHYIIYNWATIQQARWTRKWTTYRSFQLFIGQLVGGWFKIMPTDMKFVYFLVKFILISILVYIKLSYAYCWRCSQGNRFFLRHPTLYRGRLIVKTYIVLVYIEQTPISYINRFLQRHIHFKTYVIIQTYLSLLCLIRKWTEKLCDLS